MAVTKKCFLKTINIYVKILPQLTQGIEIIGFINNYPETTPPTFTIFVDMNDGMILGISQNCYDEFGIPPKYVYGFAQDGTEMNID